MKTATALTLCRVYALAYIIRWLVYLRQNKETCRDGWELDHSTTYRSGLLQYYFTSASICHSSLSLLCAGWFFPFFVLLLQLKLSFGRVLDGCRCSARLAQLSTHTRSSIKQFLYYFHWRCVFFFFCIVLSSLDRNGIDTTRAQIYNLLD